MIDSKKARKDEEKYTEQRRKEKGANINEFKDTGNARVLVPLLGMLMKMTMKGAQTQRDICGAVFDTFIAT